LRLLEPVADPAAPLARRSPVAKLAAAFGLSLVLLAAVDPVTPAVALLVELTLLPLFGLRLRPLVRRAWPLLASIVGIALTQLLFPADRPGPVLVTFGPYLLTTGMLLAALGLALRVLAIALPGIVFVASTDPTDLADSLIQHARVPARFAIGALAAFRLVPLLADEWELLTMARRARGVDAGRNPVAHARLFGSTMFALLVGAIRRATRMATAMEARGFDAGVPRSVARPQSFTAADAALIAGGVLLAAGAITLSVLLGTFRGVW
jgi:energy-coupling factor transport system permease protein